MRRYGYGGGNLFKVGFTLMLGFLSARAVFEIVGVAFLVGLVLAPRATLLAAGGLLVVAALVWANRAAGHSKTGNMSTDAVRRSLEKQGYPPALIERTLTTLKTTSSAPARPLAQVYPTIYRLLRWVRRGNHY